MLLYFIRPPRFRRIDFLPNAQIDSCIAAILVSHWLYGSFAAASIGSQ
jgi:hypothetical protein